MIDSICVYRASSSAVKVQAKNICLTNYYVVCYQLDKFLHNHRLFNVASMTNVNNIDWLKSFFASSFQRSLSGSNLVSQLSFRDKLLINFLLPHRVMWWIRWSRFTFFKSCLFLLRVFWLENFKRFLEFKRPKFSCASLKVIRIFY